MGTFRKEYRKLTPEEVAHVNAIKDAAEVLEALLFPRPVPISGTGAREFALARTKLEECVMWATKACT